MENKLSPITPGSILLEIINGKREISTDTALRLGKYFGIEPEFWLNLQMRFNMKIAKERSEKIIEQEVKTYIPNNVSPAAA